MTTAVKWVAVMPCTTENEKKEALQADPNAGPIRDLTADVELEENDDDSVGIRSRSLK